MTLPACRTFVAAARSCSPAGLSTPQHESALPTGSIGLTSSERAVRTSQFEPRDGQLVTTWSPSAAEAAVTLSGQITA
jgi:hypothetical protein